MINDEPPQLPRVDASIAPAVGFPPPLVFLGFILLGLLADRVLAALRRAGTGAKNAPKSTHQV